MVVTVIIFAVVACIVMFIAGFTIGYATGIVSIGSRLQNIADRIGA